jgi:AAA domain
MDTRRTSNGSTFDWQSCIDALTDTRLEELAAWRGYSLKFCKWLRDQSLIGLYLGGWAFPVQDMEGNVIGAHYLRGDPAAKQWRFSPGATAEPFIIGKTEMNWGIATAPVAHCFESQWDAFAFLDISGAYLSDEVAVVITRGAANGSKIAERTCDDTKLYVWTQNDAAAKNGDAPSEKWFKAIKASVMQDFYRVATPRPHKDLNDWTRAGATKAAILQAVHSAAPIVAQGSETIPTISFCSIESLPDKPPKEVIGGLLRVGQVALIGGHSKKWKSYAFRDMLFCAANGIPWLCFEPAQGVVIDIDFECEGWDLRRRYELLRECYGQGDFSNIKLAIMRGQAASIDRLNHLAELLSSQSISPTLIGVDPVYRLLGGKNENDAGVITEMMNKFLAIASNTGSALVSSHHFSKGDQSAKEAIDRFSGSGVWGRHPNALMTFTENAQQDCFTVNVVHRSFPPRQDFVVRWQYPRFLIEKDGDPEDLKVREKGRPTKNSAQDLCHLIAADDTVSYSHLWQLAQIAWKISQRTFDRRLKEAKDKGWIYRTPNDEYGLTVSYINRQK